MGLGEAMIEIRNLTYAEAKKIVHELKEQEIEARLYATSIKPFRTIYKVEIQAEPTK